MNREQIITELNFKTSRSSGPGGQNVNKTETQVEALFDINASMALSEAEKLLVIEKLQNRIDSEGVLHVVSNTTRSQIRNRREVVNRLLEMIEQSLQKPKPRKASKPSKAAVAKRLDSKAQHSERKKSRGWKYGD